MAAPEARLATRSITGWRRSIRFPAALDDDATAAAWRALLESGGADPRRYRNHRAIQRAAGWRSPWRSNCVTRGRAVARGDRRAVAVDRSGDHWPIVAAATRVFDPVLKSEDLKMLAAQYLEPGDLGRADPRDPYVSPLYGDPHAACRRRCSRSAATRSCADDSERMAQRMRAAGRRCSRSRSGRACRMSGNGFAPILPEARRAILRIGAFIQQHAAP